MSNQLRKMKKQNKKSKQWTKGKSVGENKKFYKHNLNELNETFMENYPNLTINSTLFSNVGGKNTSMNVFSIMRNDELFFMGQLINKETRGGELHIRKANDYEQEDFCVTANCKEALCSLSEYVLDGLNNGVSVEELHRQLLTIETAMTLMENCQMISNYEKRVA